MGKEGKEEEKSFRCGSSHFFPWLQDGVEEKAEKLFLFHIL